MSKAKRNFLKKYNKLLIGLIGFLGIFTSCEPEIDDTIETLYGIQYAEYENLDSIILANSQINENIELLNIEE